MPDDAYTTAVLELRNSISTFYEAGGDLDEVTEMAEDLWEDGEDG